MIALVFTAAIFFTFQSIAMKRMNASGIRQNLLLTGCQAALMAVGFWIYACFADIHMSPFTLAIGALFGVMFVITIVCYFYAMQIGPLSYTTFFYSASMLIPSLAGILIWNEPFTWQVGVGMALFLIAFYLIGVPGGETGRKVSGKWILFCFLSWLCNGCCSLIIKAHQMHMLGQESNEVLMAAFPVAAIVGLGAYALLRRRSSDIAAATDTALLRTSAIGLAIAAVGNGGGNALVSFLASRVESAYLYPMVLGGVLLLVTLYSALVLKEKINWAGASGIAVGISAIIVMNIA